MKWVLHKENENFWLELGNSDKYFSPQKPSHIHVHQQCFMINANFLKKDSELSGINIT